MSYDHSTVGWEKYEAYVQALRDAGISVHEIPDFILNDFGQEAYIRGSEAEHNEFCEPGVECPHIQPCRLAHFTTIDGKSMVVEEWIRVRDRDCDGVDVIDIAVYPQGQRPELQTEILEPFDPWGNA
jgi:hypothetical protein